jgi:hypothetical protein
MAKARCDRRAESTKRDMTFFWVGESRRPACLSFAEARSLLAVHLSSLTFNNLVPRLMLIDLTPGLSNFIILIVLVDKPFVLWRSMSWPPKPYGIRNKGRG